MVDVFGSDIFSLRSWIAAINNATFVPGRLGELGIFQAAGITTTKAAIEKDGDSLGLVPNTPRGSDPPPADKTKRTAVSIEALHLAERTAILAEEVQNARAFGDDMAAQTFEALRDQRAEWLRRRLEATNEWHRVGAVRGLIRQPNGDTILDLYDEFDITQEVVELELDDATTDLAVKGLDILEAMEAGLGAFPFTRARGIVGSSLWRKLIKHAKVRDAYLNTAAAEALRADRRDAFEFGGIIWERYRGSVGGQPYVPATEGYVFPEGVNDLFITRYAPADYAETVNTLGLPSYAKQERMRFDRGVEIEGQSNPIHLCTRPQAVIRVVEDTEGS